MKKDDNSFSSLQGFPISILEKDCKKKKCCKKFKTKGFACKKCPKF